MIHFITPKPFPFIGFIPSYFCFLSSFPFSRFRVFVFFFLFASSEWRLHSRFSPSLTQPIFFDHHLEVLRHHECLKSSKEGLDKCTIEAIDSLLRVTKGNESLWLPGSCCYLSAGRKCTLDVINSKCTGSSIDYMVKSLNSFHGDAFDLACGSNYVFGSKKCDEIISKMPSLKPGTKKPKSFMPVTLELMSKFFTSNFFSISHFFSLSRKIRPPFSLFTQSQS